MFYDTSSVYCIACPPSKVKSSSVTVYWTPSANLYYSHPLLSSKHHTAVCVYEFLSAS